MEQNLGENGQHLIYEHFNLFYSLKYTIVHKNNPTIYKKYN